jgi:hypothetical protein
MAEKDKAKDLVNSVEKIAAAKAAKENQSLAAELEKSFSNLASVQEKLAKENAKTAKTIKDGAAAELEQNKKQQKELIKQIENLGENEERATAQKTLDELNLKMKITAEKAEATAEWQQSSAGQAFELKKELESQGKIAEDNKEYSKLSFKARQADFQQRLDDAETPAARKQIREDMRADAKKNGSRLEKIGAAVGGMWANSKKVLIGGAKALLSTLAIGGLLFALGKFLQSDTFKEMASYISGTIIPKLKEFYDAFFGKEGSLWKGITALFSDDEKTGGLGRIVAGIAIATALIVGFKIVALALAVSAFLASVGAFANKIRGVKPKLPVPAGTPGATGATPRTITNPSMKNPAGQQIGKGGKPLAGTALDARNQKIERFKAQKPIKPIGKLSGIIKRFPKFGRLPGPLMAILEASTLDWTKSNKELVKPVSKILAGLAGGAIGAIGGGGVFSALLATGGYMLGQAYAGPLMEPIAEFLLGMREDTPNPSARDKSEERGRNVGTLKQGPGRGTKDERINYLEYRKKTEQSGQKPMKFKDFQKNALIPANIDPRGSQEKFEVKTKAKDGTTVEEMKKADTARKVNSTGSGVAVQNNVDARQSSSVTTTGSSGQSSIRNNKFGRLNINAAGSGFDM